MTTMKWFAPPDSSKREELKTYRSLGLSREVKSARQRRRLSGGGARLLIGGNASGLGQPELIVNRELYQRTRAEVLHNLLLEARDTWPGMTREKVLDLLAPRVERETYERLARAHYHAPRVASAFQRLQGRDPTAKERDAFIPPAAPSTEPTPYESYRGGVLDELVGQIQARQSHNPNNYQSVWAELVGPEIAQQSRLEKILPESATAFFRCLNSALSYQLQRRADLPQKLTRALRIPIRQLRVMY